MPRRTDLRGYPIQIQLSAYGGPDIGFTSPILLTHIFNKKNKSHFELGAGVNFTSSLITFDGPLFGATANFMYRYQKPKGKFIFRAGWTPIYFPAFGNELVSTIVFLLYPGVSIGYAF